MNKVWPVVYEEKVFFLCQLVKKGSENKSVGMKGRLVCCWRCSSCLTGAVQGFKSVKFTELFNILPCVLKMFSQRKRRLLSMFFRLQFLFSSLEVRRRVSDSNKPPLGRGDPSFTADGEEPQEMFPFSVSAGRSPVKRTPNNTRSCSLGLALLFRGFTQTSSWVFSYLSLMRTQTPVLWFLFS